jgi:hypothetical protein
MLFLTHSHVILYVTVFMCTRIELLFKKKLQIINFQFYELYIK